MLALGTARPSRPQTSVVGGSRFAATANAELSLRLSAPGRRSASLRANQSLEPTVMGLHPSSAWRNPIPAAQLRIMARRNIAELPQNEDEGPLTNDSYHKMLKETNITGMR
jgi:hypothetical protein